MAKHKHFVPTLCCILLLCALITAGGLLFTPSAHAATAANPLGCVQVDMTDLGDTVLTEDFTYGKPLSASCEQSPLSFITENSDNDLRVDMRSGSDYVYSGSTVTLKRNFLRNLGEGMYWLNFETGDGNKEYCLDIRGESKWIVNSKKGNATANGNATTLTLNGWTGDYATDGRARYADALDVTKPIRVAVQNMEEGMGEWIMLALDSTPYASEYMSETSRTPGVVKVLDMAVSSRTGERERLQGWAGLVYTASTAGISHLVSQTNLNIFEFVIGEEVEDSYLAVNGQKIGLTSFVSRSDFPQGKAYLSLFVGKTGTSKSVTFDICADVQAPMAYFGQEIPEVKYAAKTQTDFQAKIAGAGPSLTLLHNGSAVAADDYTFDTETNVLTVKGSYLKTLPYEKEMQFTLESDGHRSDLRIATALPDTVTAGVADSESTVKYYEDADITFAMQLNGENFVGVIDSATGLAVSETVAKYQDGTLTFFKENLDTQSNGMYMYLVETDNSLFPLAIIKEAFTHGVANKGESADYEVRCGKLHIRDSAFVTVRELVDLSNTVEWKTEISAIGNYYQNGAAGGDTQSYIELRLWDMISDKTLIVRLRANGATDNTAIRYKTWVDFLIVDADGATVGNAMRVFSKVATVGTHTLKLENNTKDGKIVFTLNGDTSVAVDANDINLKNLQLSVQSTADYKFVLSDARVDYSALENAVSKAKNKSGAQYEAALRLHFGASQAEADAAAKAIGGKGCGGALHTSLPVAAAVLLIMAVAAAVSAKKRNTNARKITDKK